MTNLTRSIWFDESFSAYLTRFDFAHIWEFTAADVHPPFYYFVLKAWAKLFGRTDFSLRSLSMVFGAIAILMAFLWLKYKYGTIAAIFGTFLLSISPTLVRYGQEMRMYTLIVAIVFAATYVLQLAIDHGGKKWWFLYACLLALGMWTHYFVVFAWIAHFFYLLKIYKKRLFKQPVLKVYFLAVLLFLPWVPGLISQIADVQGHGFWVPALSFNGLANYWTEALVYEKASQTQNWLLILALVNTGLFVYLLYKYRRNFVLLRYLATIPVVILVLLSMPPLNSMFIPRYLIYAIAALPLIGGVGCAFFMRDSILHAERAAKKRRAKAVAKTPSHIIVEPAVALWRRPIVRAFVCLAIFAATSLCGLRAVAVHGSYNFDSNAQSASRELYSDLLALDAGKNLPIIAASPWLYYDLSFYADGAHQMFFLDETTKYDYGSMRPLEKTYFGKIRDLDRFLSNKTEIWYVGSTPELDNLSFPRDDWEISEISNFRYNEYSDSYQILKLTKKI
ncbi:glycosyltransferase family 39 protein [Candidatus Saccharibacteria bacterium]|nr:glycosyltransferase family 39 protein [Candidatus Saccharibacteria bacterium]